MSFGAIWAVVSRIPLQVWLVTGFLAAAFGWHIEQVHKAVAARDAHWADVIAEQDAAYEKQVEEIRAKQQEVVYRTVIEYRDRVHVVKEKADEIAKEVPVLVPRSVGVLPGGMRVVHDAAATGDVPDDPQRAADTAAPVDATTLAATVAANYETCRANAEELVALQSLVTSLKGASP